jgi:hypothetical protein
LITFRRCFREQAGNEGGGSGASGSGAPPAGQGGASGQPPTSGEAPKSGSTEPPAGYVPAESLRAVTAERDKLKRAADEAERKKLEAQGEHEKLAATEKERADAEAAKGLRIARRAAFISVAAGKVADPAAAFTLARDAGLVEYEVDDDGAPKDVKAVEAALAEVVKRYPFLKAQGAPTEGFGGNHGATGGAPGSVDPEKMTPLQKMEYGIAQASKR